MKRLYTTHGYYNDYDYEVAEDMGWPLSYNWYPTILFNVSRHWNTDRTKSYLWFSIHLHRRERFWSVQYKTKPHGPDFDIPF